MTTGSSSEPARPESGSPGITSQLLAEQDWQKAVTAGMIAAVIGAALWAIITYITEMQIGFMAIGIGFLVGFAVQKYGKGVEKRFGILGAGLSLAGVLLGNLFAIIAFASHEFGVGFFQMLGAFDWGAAPSLITSTLGPIDLLFYGIALYEGYRFSFRPIPVTEPQPAG
jgi:hypothetical protein